MSKRIVQFRVHRANFEAKYNAVKGRLKEFDQKTRIYIDTNIFSRAADLRISTDQARALKRIKTRKDIELYTSEKAREEVMRHQDAAKQDFLQFILDLFEVIPEENFIHHTSGAFGSGSFGSAPFGGGGSSEDPLYRELKTLFDPDDAQHIFHAIKSNAKFFLTLDEATILNRKANFNELGHSLKLVSPVNLEKILFVEEDNT